MKTEICSMKDHLNSYNLYLKLVDVLIGSDIETARMALKKCLLNLDFAELDEEERNSRSIIT